MMLPDSYRQPSMLMVRFLSPGEHAIHAQVYLRKTVKEMRALAPDRTNIEIERMPGRVEKMSLIFDEPASIVHVTYHVDLSNLPVTLPEDDEPFARAVDEVEGIGDASWGWSHDLSLFTIIERYSIKHLESTPLLHLWHNAMIVIAVVDSILERFRKASDATNSTAPDGNEAVES